MCVRGVKFNTLEYLECGEREREVCGVGQPRQERQCGNMCRGGVREREGLLGNHGSSR